ncbi:MAG: Tyrocidine synthase 3 [Chlamydiia bacterium]|nr:Tyrocidine synthase 3 [Chlamydiia bacterium]MCH9618974.1 Tyrocidine synthase 3 [Chlamydiia bacterium]MCH9623816.1 Tyrocidine synthase 3 [Chlamydiia bacterium]
MTINFCHLVSRNAKKIPTKVAVRYSDKALSYLELDNLSTLLASQLIQKGVQPGDVIGIGLFNSISLLVGILGVLKSGGVYLPLDPNYPDTRISNMTKDSNTKLIIIDNDSRTFFESIQIDKYNFDILSPNHTVVELPILSPKQPAYVVYTSGSTGIPKGILVSHSSLSYAISSFVRMFSSPPCSLITGSISFDPSILIITHALTTGGTVCLYDNKGFIDLKDFTQITKTINNCRVDFILSTPSFYSKILKEQNKLYSLKHVLLCGEKIHDQLIHEHILLASKANLYNSYGPSEYAIGTTIALIYNSLQKKQFPITIGKPFGENKLYILDNDLNYVPVGQEGEFFIGGPGLALGYLNQKQLTEKNFIQCTHLENGKIELYRTGDMGYQKKDGNFVFINRKDSQVKVNGHRVELEEIESTVMENGEIEKAVVILHNQNLILFYSNHSEFLNINTLKRNLEMTLPSYMIPKTFINIKKWPINCNGKINREALIEKLF